MIPKHKGFVVEESWPSYLLLLACGWCHMSLLLVRASSSPLAVSLFCYGCCLFPSVCVMFLLVCQSC